MSFPRMLGRAVIRRCPRCGGGQLFDHWFTMRQRCPTCGYRFERQPGFALGAMAINIGVVMALFAGLVVSVLAVSLPDVPVRNLTITAALLNTIVPIVFYPFSKTIWAAIDLQMRPLEPAEEADALLAQRDLEARRSPGERLRRGVPRR